MKKLVFIFISLVMVFSMINISYAKPIKVLGNQEWQKEPIVFKNVTGKNIKYITFFEDPEYDEDGNIIEKEKEEVTYTNEDIQEALKEKGYYDGEIDGSLGPASIESVKKYEEDNNLEVSDEITDQFVQSLLKISIDGNYLGINETLDSGETAHLYLPKELKNAKNCNIHFISTDDLEYDIHIFPVRSTKMFFLEKSGNVAFIEAKEEIDSISFINTFEDEKNIYEELHDKSNIEVTEEEQK